MNEPTPPGRSRAWDVRTMRSIALQESKALREFARAGKNPKCAPTWWPWDE